LAGERRLRLVQVAHVVFGWIFGLASIKQFPHAVLHLHRVVTFSDKVVLVKHMTEEMPIVELMDDWLLGVVWQFFDPIPVIAP
jgi:hypothetical protein